MTHTDLRLSPGAGGREVSDSPRRSRRTTFLGLLDRDHLRPGALATPGPIMWALVLLVSCHGDR